MAATGSRSVTRVLIHEPHPELQAFLVRLVGQLGYEPVPCGSEPAAASGDILLLDTGSDEALPLVRALRRENPLLPIVCAGNELPGAEMLAFEPVAFLVKPFAVAECERALQQAAALWPAHLC